MKKIIPLIKKYLPDSLILFGILILSYSLLPHSRMSNRFGGGGSEYYFNYKIFAIFILTLGIIIAVRRCFASKNK